MKTIYLEPDEGIISVIDRLSQTKIKEVNLVVPAGAQIWQNSINLTLLKREAESLGKEITLSVPDDLRAEAAQRVGFIVKKERNLPTELIQEEPAKEDMIGLLVKELKSEKKESTAGGKKREEPRKMVDIVTPGGKSEALRPTSPELRPGEQTQSRFSPRRFLKKRLISPMPREKGLKKWPKFFIIFIGLAFLVAALVGYLALPTTEIIISPKTEKVSFDLMVVGSKDISRIDESLNKIPLQEIKVEKTKSKKFPATGEKEVNKKARGIITVYNEYSSSPQTLVATTRFESPQGKIFRIEENVIVPGAKIEEGKIVPSNIKTEAVADQPGADYNIGPANFTIPGFKGTAKYVGFYAKSESLMTEGFTGKIKIVLAEDLSKAEESLTEELKNELKQTLQEQIPTDLKLVEEELEEKITDISTVKEGTEADNFTLEMNVIVRALLFKEEDFKNLVDLNLISKISENKAPLLESQQIDWQETVIDWDEGEVTFNLSVEEEVVWQIDIPSLKKDLAGQSEIEVRRYLANQPAIDKAKVTFWPFWVKRIPLQEKKIKIEVILD